MSKVVFTNNRKNLESVRNNSRNELVWRLIDIMLKENEFDCDNKQFRAILNELIIEYDRLEKEFVVKNSKDATPELKDIIERTAFMLSYILEEADKQSNVSEINLSTYLAKLSQFTNIIQLKYPEVEKIAENKETILEKIRKWGPIKKFFIGAAVVGTIGAGAMIGQTTQTNNAHPTNNITNNITTKNVEIKKDNQKKATVQKSTIDYEKAKAISEAKVVSKVDLDTIPKAPPGFKYLKTVTAKVTAYNPTGPGLMANGYPERGITSTGRDAINNLDGVAIDPKLVPYGSMVYIINPKSRNVWKLADDTGSAIRRDGNKGITHVDLRAEGYKWALKYGKKYLTVHVFVPNSYKPTT